MKRKLALLFSVMSLSMAATGCGPSSQKTAKLSYLSLVCNAYKNYIVGDNLLNCTDIKITGHYSNGKDVLISQYDVAFTLTSGMNVYSVYNPLPAAGNYSLTATYKEVTSNPFNFTVASEHVYAESMDVSGPSVISIEWPEQINVTVSPSNCTEQINFYSTDESVATISRIDNSTFEIVGHANGTALFVFEIPGTPDGTIRTKYHSVDVQSVEKTKIKQTYNEYNLKNYENSAGCPSIGNPKLLILPIWFYDSASFIDLDKRDLVRQDIQSAFFASGNELGYYSVASYYNEESNGRLNLTGTVSEWCELGETYTASYYSGDDDYLSKTCLLLNSAVNWYFDNHTSDSRSNYDYNGDGYMDGVVLIYAAPNYATYSRSPNPGYGEDKTNLWAYVTSLGAATMLISQSPKPNTFMWASYDFMYRYNDSLTQERTGHNLGYVDRGDRSYFTIDAHTYTHEMGHIFGLKDYYDYSSTVSYAGRYSMQDVNVCGHDPYSVMALGWADPYIPTKSCQITINDFQSSRELILLTPQWNSYDSAFDEYLLLELYTPTGLNRLEVANNYMNWGKSPNAVGIRLWHVNSTLYKKNGNFYKNVNEGQVMLAFNNSKCKAEGGRDCNAKPVNTYKDYSQLRLVRKDVNESYFSNDRLVASDLFYADDSFAMNTYQSQFIKGPYLDGVGASGNVELGWTFRIKQITELGDDHYSATITLTKTA